jgi:hypothetical protein
MKNKKTTKKKTTKPRKTNTTTNWLLMHEILKAVTTLNDELKQKRKDNYFNKNKTDTAQNILSQKEVHFKMDGTQYNYLVGDKLICYMNEYEIKTIFLGNGTITVFCEPTIKKIAQQEKIKSIVFTFSNVSNIHATAEFYFLSKSTL